MSCNNNQQITVTQFPAIASNLHWDKSLVVGEGHNQNQLPVTVRLLPCISE